MATTYLSNFFNSRSPHGERQSKHEILIIRIYFQFTLPAWRATKKLVAIFRGASYFQFTLSAWRATYLQLESLQSLSFQFTLPAWRATVVGFSYDFILLLLFISANQEKAYFLPCFFGFSSLCCLWFAPVLLILFSRL